MKAVDQTSESVRKMKLIHVVGARPNFMKAAPVIAAAGKRPGVNQILVHTGQHYDFNMSDVFFEQLRMSVPNLNLEVGSGSHAAQTAQTMMCLEPILLEKCPDMVLVYGDVNSTVAAALVCAKQLIPIAHIEAGLRSGDRTMPEEINRLITDQLSDVLLTPSLDADKNLLREGISAEKIEFVGNVMIDTLVKLLPLVRKPRISGLNKNYVLVTLHRPANVDDPLILTKIIYALSKIGNKIQVIFSAHPRTCEQLSRLSLDIEKSSVQFVEPQGYLEFLWLQQHATIVITDSGGIQEETTYLGIPCLTVRKNTERPITVSIGTNILVGQDMNLLLSEVEHILNGTKKLGQIPPLWDGYAAERIADRIISHKL